VKQLHAPGAGYRAGQPRITLTSIEEARISDRMMIANQSKDASDTYSCVDVHHLIAVPENQAPCELVLRNDQLRQGGSRLPKTTEVLGY